MKNYCTGKGYMRAVKMENLSSKQYLKIKINVFKLVTMNKKITRRDHTSSRNRHSADWRLYGIFSYSRASKSLRQITLGKPDKSNLLGMGTGYNVIITVQVLQDLV